MSIKIQAVLVFYRLPFGGYKESGVGRDKGESALHHYTITKVVYQVSLTPLCNFF